jgi:RNA polymerase sigma factor (sigma-70 family)
LIEDGRRHAVTEDEVRDFLAHDYPRLVNALALTYGSWTAAEDAVQEALARAWERSERGLHIEAPRGWVLTVARNLLRDRCRRFLAEGRARELLGAGTRARDPIASADDRADISTALGMLPRRQREVTVLRYYLDLDEIEIARTLRVPVGTVKSSLFRARRALAGALGAEPADGNVEARRGR